MMHRDKNDNAAMIKKRVECLLNINAPWAASKFGVHILRTLRCTEMNSLSFERDMRISSVSLLLQNHKLCEFRLRSYTSIRYNSNCFFSRMK